ncbi:MAG: ABC transporter ATP-binding protein [Chloroflexi bacterium]|nr:ABC transporter ATP-binding protein [Chloroflexota bacterium]
MTLPLETRELAIGYSRRGRGDVRLGQGLNLRLQSGKLVGLLGPNGIGKSTLLRTLAGVQKPLAGELLLAGDDIRRLKPRDLAGRLSMVLTAIPPPSLMNGYALVALGRHPHTDWLGRMTERDHRQVTAALRSVKGEDLAERPVAELSDGQRQKLLIARALAQGSEIMLLDEPTAFLDLPRRIQTVALLKHLARNEKRAILVSTHDLDLAIRYCDKLWLMSASGIVSGAPEDLVLDGSLGMAFRASGIRFDTDRGSFFLDPPGRGTIYVEGNCEHANWLRRAVTRAGFEVGEKPGRTVLSRSGNGHDPGWKLRIDERVTLHETIEAVLNELEGQFE